MSNEQYDRIIITLIAIALGLNIGYLLTHDSIIFIYTSCFFGVCAAVLIYIKNIKILKNEQRKLDKK